MSIMKLSWNEMKDDEAFDEFLEDNGAGALTEMMTYATKAGVEAKVDVVKESNDVVFTMTGERAKLLSVLCEVIGYDVEADEDDNDLSEEEFDELSERLITDA